MFSALWIRDGRYGLKALQSRLAKSLDMTGLHMTDLPSRLHYLVARPFDGAGWDSTMTSRVRKITEEAGYRKYFCDDDPVREPYIKTRNLRLLR